MILISKKRDQNIERKNMAKKRLFIDTNIIIDLLADRLPYSNSAYALFSSANKDKWDLFTSTNSILTTYFIIKEKVGQKKAKRALKTIINKCTVKDLNNEDLITAIESRINDLEDASQEVCARKVGKVDYIISRDKKGFKHSHIDALTAEEFLVLKL